jgi:hypothetical protein
MSINVFLSVGRASTPEQEQFITTLEKYLSSHGLTPQTVGRTYFKNQQPLKSVAECMADCAGTIILAFERLYIHDGAERRGSKHQSPVGNVTLPTVWNQIEAAMAYTLGHPLLVLVENGIKSEGLLEHGYDWYVKWIELQDTAFGEPEFIGVFTDWKTAVEDHYKALPFSKNRQTTLQGKVSNTDIEANSEETTEQIAHYRTLIKESQKRLRVLEVQSVQFGMEMPPHIQLELDAINERIRTYQNTINLLKH